MNNIILFEQDNNILFFNRDVKHLVFKYNDIHYTINLNTDSKDHQNLEQQVNNLFTLIKTLQINGTIGPQGPEGPKKVNKA